MNLIRIALGTGLYMIRVVDNKAQRVLVSRGRVMDKAFEVFGDIEEGDLILVRANEEIQEGMEIKK